MSEKRTEQRDKLDELMCEIQHAVVIHLTERGQLHDLNHVRLRSLILEAVENTLRANPPAGYTGEERMHVLEVFLIDNTVKINGRPVDCDIHTRLAVGRGKGITIYFPAKQSPPRPGTEEKGNYENTE